MLKSYKVKTFIFFILLFTLIFVSNSSILPPSVRCITVLSNGEVRLNWIQPFDSAGTFDSYHIYYSTKKNGPYALLDSIFNYNTINYTHSGAGIDSTFYFIKSRFNSSGLQYSFPSDTLAVMLLTINKNISGQAGLSWNSIHSPQLPSTATICHIYREYPTGNWQLIDSVIYSTETFSEPLVVCADSIQYWIEISDASGCTSVSSKKKDWFVDKLPPSTPVIDSVSVDTVTGFISLGWEPITTGDAEGYIIARNTGSNWSLDTVWGNNNTFYVDSNSNPSTYSEQYGIAAFDSCWLGSPPSPNTSPTGILHRSIHVKGTLDQCNRSISLVWNKYEGWNGIKSYSVYVNQNGTALQLLSINTANDTSFTHTNLTPFSNYCYTIYAIASDGIKTSTSNSLCMTMYIPQPPRWLYISNVSVNTKNHITISCYVDNQADIRSYIIKRSSNALSGFSTIAEIMVTGDSILTYIDGTAEIDKREYYYKIIAKDICNDECRESNSSSTIFLSATQSNNFINMLQWNHSVGWDSANSNIKTYHIYKSNNDNLPANLITSESFSTNTYLDDISGELTSTGTFCYYIVAEEDENNIYGFKENRQSNTICVYYEPIIWIPNAFTPNGDNTNEIFKPVISFLPSEDYLFLIYNRWGDVIFKTTNMLDGWDGKLNNAYVQNGLYMYHITLKTSQNRIISKNGSVFLLR